MNKHAAAITARLSLRKPQADALNILARIGEKVSLTKGADPKAALDLIKAEFTHVEDFERAFPSLCFAIATGVGKTRLMGAFIAYLYAAKNIRHFFVLAPNLTIYNKLIADFTPNTPKYVFAGIAEFAANRPRIITGDNYESVSVNVKPGTKAQMDWMVNEVHINIFNISKLNKDAKDTDNKGLPRIKRLSEYIGQSYFEYLAELDDLVLLMDESHRYRGDAGVRVLDELKPVLGLELTATPQTESGTKTVSFKNVIYNYPLSAALKDGFVKDPAVATRKDFNAKIYSEPELERLKLEDAVRVHEFLKPELVQYAHETGAQLVKPFILVIAKDTPHAAELEALIKSTAFFDGRYADKVIRVDSDPDGKKSKAEKDENVARLLAVESVREATEIVIHVNMLKEGWDVTNLYTIVPLRAANSKVLIEQSIGRGLRLPYGKRTGVTAIDRLNIIAHDRFEEIINEANKPESVIRSGFVIGVDIPDAGQKIVTVAPSVTAVLFGPPAASTATPPGSTGTPAPLPSAAPVKPPVFSTPAEQAAATAVLENLQKLSNTLGAPSLDALAANPSAVMSQVIPVGTKQEDLPLFQKVTQQLVAALAANTISIPRIIVVPSGDISSGYKDFDLDTSGINFPPVEQTIFLKYLQDSGKQDELAAADTGPMETRPENYILRGLIDFDDVDYSTQAELLNKLCTQAVERIRSYLKKDEDVFNVVMYHQRPLANLIHAQMDKHFWQHATDYVATVKDGFKVPEPIPYKIPVGTEVQNFRTTVMDKHDIRNKLFTGFKKCIYTHQKFDVDKERTFAAILEDDGAVLKWLKPSMGEFKHFIEYAKQASYNPDFVVETTDRKYICEVKREDQMKTDETQAKARAAATWCKHATEHAKTNGGKTWSYVLIPDTQVAQGKTLLALAQSFTFSGA